MDKEKLNSVYFLFAIIIFVFGLTAFLVSIQILTEVSDCNIIKEAKLDYVEEKREFGIITCKVKLNNGGLVSLRDIELSKLI